MEQELIQAAVNTFCAVPEVYQKAFQQMGADFPDELVQAIKTKPEDAVKMVQNDQELLKGIVTIYQQYGDQINQAAQQKTGLFKKGGKLEYLQSGGSIIIEQQKPKGIRGLFWEPTFQKRADGVPGGVASWVTPKGVRTTEVRGPYTTYSQIVKPNGTTIVDVNTKSTGDRYRTTKNGSGYIPEDLVSMFNKISSRVKMPPIVFEK